jgi:hypothetical protein
VENLYLKRLDPSEDYIVRFENAVNCWMRNCESEQCMRAHVWLFVSRFTTIEGCYFHHAYNYGEGGHGYGVVAANKTTDCLVTDNVFRHLRHSMMTKEGANGNVFSYNFSIENVSDANNVKLPDISIHGHYSYMNLFEGNAVQHIAYADAWGPTGPRTTCFRNRVTTHIDVLDHSHGANLEGNTLLSGRIRVQESCQDVWHTNNLIEGQLTGPSPAPSYVPSSLYLRDKPAFWGDRPWPAIGADVDARGNHVPIPAQERYSRYLRRRRKVRDSRRQTTPV